MVNSHIGGKKPCYAPYEIPTPACANGISSAKNAIQLLRQERKNMAIQLLHRAQSEPLGAPR